MGSLRDPSVRRCEHGYEVDLAQRDCPRCADRPVMPRVEARLRHTPWHETGPTVGPRLKTVITLALVVPLLIMTVELRHATQQPAYTFLVVPIAGLALFAAQFLPNLWEPGRTRIDRSADDTESAN